VQVKVIISRDVGEAWTKVGGMEIAEASLKAASMSTSL